MQRFAYGTFFAALALGSGLLATAQTPLGGKADYAKYVDPLLTAELGVSYVEDGAADATVLFPPNAHPSESVKRLVDFGPRALPLLIDCLSDGRVSRVRFAGGSVAKPLNVPLGYVCLDILLAVTPAAPVLIRGCADDGLGACVRPEYYFRPDDYSQCWADHCLARPWVGKVQQNWRHLFKNSRLLFVDPYRAITSPRPPNRPAGG
ncbi:MAG: hypothetical protein ABSC08_08265 [Bryobacteraceae bacterium]|jgi:hypothetical protein